MCSNTPLPGGCRTAAEELMAWPMFSGYDSDVAREKVVDYVTKLYSASIRNMSGNRPHLQHRELTVEERYIRHRTIRTSAFRHEPEPISGSDLQLAELLHCQTRC